MKHQTLQTTNIDYRLQEIEVIIKELNLVLQKSNSMSNSKSALNEAYYLSGNFLNHIEIQRIIIQLREKAGDTEFLLNDIEEILKYHPNDTSIIESYLRRLIKLRKREQAFNFINESFPLFSSDTNTILKRAELLDRIQDFKNSDLAYSYILKGGNGDVKLARISWAKRLVKRAHFEDAGLLLENKTITKLTGEKGSKLVESIELQRKFFRRFITPEQLIGKDFRLLAMELAILNYTNRSIPEFFPRQIKLQLMTGHLGTGGAERQLSGLSRLIKKEIINNKLNPRNSFSNIEVIVNEHSRPGISDFFLDDLHQDGIVVHEIKKMAPLTIHEQEKYNPYLNHLLKILPSQINFGVERLTPHFRMTRPDIVSLWQDGSCLTGALAALIAGVPRIQLVFRGLPPNIRLDRYKPEYELLYKTIAKIPGVNFISNSRAGAIAYSDWLSIPIDRFSILYNGVEFPRTAGEISDKVIWDDFCAKTFDATETIGGVFRIEPLKRPLDWIRLASIYLKTRPKARFIIVGDGQNMNEAKNLASTLLIQDRILFVGKSKAVGFWYQKFDVKVLLSKFEGLPNVLIEAQHLGCPVVSTPAGGAAECFDQGSTGYILDCAENPNMDQACELIRAIVDDIRKNPEHFAIAARSVAERFRTDRMLENFLEICQRPLAKN